MRDLVSYTDFLVIGTARNERQAKAIVDEVQLRLKHEHGLLPARVEGEAEARVGAARLPRLRPARPVPEMRERYRLERLWGEARRLELELEGAAD